MAFFILGLIVGVIFIADGWKESPPGVPFWKTHRMRGFAWLITGALPTFVATSQPGPSQTEAFGRYVRGVGVSLAVMAVGLLLILLVVWALEFSGRLPWKVILARSLRSFLNIVLSGVHHFELDYQTARSEVLAGALLERRMGYNLSFWSGVFERLLIDARRSVRGNRELENFLEMYLRLFLVYFFEEGDHLERFRAAYFHRKGRNLVYVWGVWGHGSAAFSQINLAVSGSLAGNALTEGDVRFFPEDRDKGFVEERGQDVYKEFVVVPVPYKKNVESKLGILTIDCRDKDHPFRQNVGYNQLTVFANVLSYAVEIYGFGSEEGKPYA